MLWDIGNFTSGDKGWHLYLKTKELDKGSTEHRTAINQELTPKVQSGEVEKNPALTTSHSHHNAYSTRIPPVCPTQTQPHFSVIWEDTGIYQLHLLSAFLKVLYLHFPPGHLCFIPILGAINVIQQIRKLRVKAGFAPRHTVCKTLLTQLNSD